MGREFTIEVIEPNPKATVMRITGRLDMKNAQTLCFECRESLESPARLAFLDLG